MSTAEQDEDYDLEPNTNHDYEPPSTTTREDIIHILHGEKVKTHPVVKEKTLEKAKEAIVKFLKDAKNPNKRSELQIQLTFYNRFTTHCVRIALKSLLDERRIFQYTQSPLSNIVDGKPDNWYEYVG